MINFYDKLSKEDKSETKLDKHFKKIPSFEIVLQTNNSNSIINNKSEKYVKHE